MSSTSKPAVFCILFAVSLSLLFVYIRLIVPCFFFYPLYFFFPFPSLSFPYNNFPFFPSSLLPSSSLTRISLFLQLYFASLPLLQSSLSFPSPSHVFPYNNSSFPSPLLHSPPPTLVLLSFSSSSVLFPYDNFPFPSPTIIPPFLPLLLPSSSLTIIPLSFPFFFTLLPTSFHSGSPYRPLPSLPLPSHKRLFLPSLPSHPSAVLHISLPAAPPSAPRTPPPFPSPPQFPFGGGKLSRVLDARRNSLLISGNSLHTLADSFKSLPGPVSSIRF